MRTGTRPRSAAVYFAMRDALVALDTLGFGSLGERHNHSCSTARRRIIGSLQWFALRDGPASQHRNRGLGPGPLPRRERPCRCVRAEGLQLDAVRVHGRDAAESPVGKRAPPSSGNADQPSRASVRAAAVNRDPPVAGSSTANGVHAPFWNCASGNRMPSLRTMPTATGGNAPSACAAAASVFATTVAARIRPEIAAVTRLASSKPPALFDLERTESRQRGCDFIDNRCH